MSRSDSPMGITPEARKFLKDNEIKPKVCSECKRPHPVYGEVIGKYSGFNEYYLHRYFLIRGFYADEFLQITEWDSGPNFFLGLRISDGREFLWTREEIEETL